MSEWGRLQDSLHDHFDEQGVTGVDVDKLIEHLVNVRDFFPGLLSGVPGGAAVSAGADPTDEYACHCPGMWIESTLEPGRCRRCGGQRCPPSEPPRPAEPLDVALLTEAFLTVFPGWIDEADGDRSEIEENAENIAAEYARLSRPSDERPEEDR
jgi:hypothetical protein